jgi:hypothetical protein
MRPASLRVERRDRAGYTAAHDTPPENARLMKLIVNSMVKNEAHHADSVMAHLTALFDEINIINHASEDDTVAKIAAWQGRGADLNFYSYTDPGYFQSELMTRLARQQVADGSADWVFFMDFDEYLPFRSRAEFEQALVQFSLYPAIQMLWHNLVPCKPDQTHHLGGSYLVGPDASPFPKIAISPKRVPAEAEIRIEQGNHAVTDLARGVPLDCQMAFGLFHIPVDGEAQLKSKIATGVRAYEDHSSRAQTELGSHWVIMRDLMEKGSAAQDVLNGFVRVYGENEKLVSLAETGELARTLDELKAEDYREIRLDLAGHDAKKPRPARAMPNCEAIDLQAPMSQSGKTKGTSPYLPANSARIPALESDNPDLSGEARPIETFLQNSRLPIQTLTPTAWVDISPSCLP